MARKMRHIVYLLAAGDNQRPKRIVCENPHCGRTAMRVSREIAYVIKDNQGIHWSDLPDDVTYVEHKCRGCEYIYHIYTPETVVSLDETLGMVKDANATPTGV